MPTVSLPIFIIYCSRDLLAETIARKMASFPEPRKVHSFRLEIDEISVRLEPGWREHQPAVMDQLVATLPETYGRTNMMPPSVLAADGNGQNCRLDVDGKVLLNNGKSFVCAMQVLCRHLRFCCLGESLIHVSFPIFRRVIFQKGLDTEICAVYSCYSF